MGNLFDISALSCLCFFISSSFSNECYKQDPEICRSGLEQPLILTPVIKQGKIKKAQCAAEVKFDEFKGVKSYSGYFTVNEQFNSNLFFWFFPSRANDVNVPVLLWLEGGPGGSTLGDIFSGNGPFELTESRLNLGKHAWIQNISVIYIDNPVGVGYSFTDEDGYAQNQTIVGEQLYEALLQFFQLFPELQNNPFFVGGISYAGKYVPAVSYTIHKNNPMAKQKINLQGLAIGDGLVDPEHQTGYGEYLYQVGLVDSNGQAQINEIENNIVREIRNAHWMEAFELVNKMFIGPKGESLYSNITGFKNRNSYLNPSAKNILKFFERFEEYIVRDNVRAAVHVADTTYSKHSHKVFLNLAADIPKSVATWLSELLGYYRVLIYNGQVDVVCAYPLTVNYIKKLNFSGADAYKTAKRYKWYVGTELAGYMKQAGNLTEVLVRNATHAVQLDQPLWLLDLITRHAYNNLLS